VQQQHPIFFLSPALQQHDGFLYAFTNDQTIIAAKISTAEPIVKIFIIID
jgi:hypothetical protein